VRGGQVSLVRDAKGEPAERKIELLNRVDYRRAETEEERDEIYRLRYRAYLNEGAIEPNRERRISDRFDDRPNSWIFGVYIDGTLASSLRISVASPQWPDSPSMTVFPDILETELAKGKVMVDPTRFVADPARAKRIPELPYVTLRLAYVACEYFHADLGLASVRAEHQAFYRRVFLHEPLSAPRDYPGLAKPICLMAVNFPAMRDKVFARYPFLRSSYFERRMLFERDSERLSPVVNLPPFPFDRASVLSPMPGEEGCAVPSAGAR
jgi:N-acyl-L-homoserine lactone synthetase